MDRPKPPVDLVECTREALDSDSRVVAAYLFGSFARGTAARDSDLDIAVLFREPVDRRLNGPLDKLRDAVERACHRPCDLIDHGALRTSYIESFVTASFS